MMSANLEQVVKNIGYLTVKEKAWVAHCLIASLDTEKEDSVEAAWAEVAEQRFFELITGKVQGISWDEIKSGLKS